MFATFIDYSAAFDSVSHKYLDTTLARGGVSDKTRPMFRAIYNSVSAYTEVDGIDGQPAKSEIFPVRQGVVQTLEPAD